MRDGQRLYEAQPGAYAAWRSRMLTQLELDRPWHARVRESWLARVAREGV